MKLAIFDLDNTLFCEQDYLINILKLFLKNEQKKGPKRTIVRERVVERNRHVRPQFLVCTVYDGARLMRGNLLLVECVDGSINPLSVSPTRDSANSASSFFFLELARECVSRI